MSAKLARCLKLLTAFQRRGELANRDVQDLLDVDEQTALRDLNSLIKADIPLERHGQGSATHYVLDSAWRRRGINFTMGEAMSLHFGRQLLAFLEGTMMPEWLDELREKLEPAADARTKDRESRFAKRLVYLSEPYRPYKPHDDMLVTLITALLDDRELEVEYEARSGARAATIQPLALVIYRRALYLLARYPGSEHVYRLTVERFLAAESGEYFAYPDEFDPHTEVHGAFGIFDTGVEAEEVRLRFVPEVADLVKARRWHPSERFEDLPDGGVDLVMDTHGPELARLALEWGDKVTVISPASLRDRVVRELRGALERYQSLDGT